MAPWLLGAIQFQGGARMRRVLVCIIAVMLVMSCIALIGCSSSDKSEPNDGKDDSAAKLAALLARMSFKPEWIKQTDLAA